MKNILDEYIKVMKQRKLKITNSRYAFLKAITSMEQKHFTVGDIIAKIKENEGHVNTMSVYNILEMLLNEHLIFANSFDGKNVSYELITPRLVHIRCDYCGKMYHLEDQDGLDAKWWSLFHELAADKGITLEHYKLEAHGMCEECKKQGKESIKTAFDVDGSKDLDA